MNIFDPQGPVAAADATILIDSVAIMLAIVLPTIARRAVSFGQACGPLSGPGIAI